MARPKGRAVERKRAEQAVQAEAAQRRVHIRNSAFIAGGALLVVAAAAAFVLLQPPAPGIAIPNLGNEHLAAVDQPHSPYNSSPPSSGPHIGTLAPWGELDQVVPPEVFIHNLEDGGVVLVYSCTDCPDLVETMRQAMAVEDRVVLFPYPDIVDQQGVPHRAAAVAWNRIFYFDELDTETMADLQQFIKDFEGIDHHVRVP